MESKLYLDILPQPDDITCGPTCLHAVYRYFGLDMHLPDVIDGVRSVDGGGTLAVYLGQHALEHGFTAKLYTYNLQMFDPTWFETKDSKLYDKLVEQVQYKQGRKFVQATKAYMEFLSHGGSIRFDDLTTGLLRKYLVKHKPILVGLSATYLYKCARERADGERLLYDDVKGEPTGHFVLLTGYDQLTRTVWIADPLRPNPVSESAQYSIDINHLVCAIMLGILTFDANLLIIEPKKV